MKTTAKVVLLAGMLSGANMAGAAWVCDQCEWVDEIGDWVILKTEGAINEHGDLEGGVTYSQVLGTNLRWGKVTVTSKNISLPNNQMWWAMAISDQPGSRQPYRSQPRCADEWAQTTSVFVLRSYVYVSPDWYCIVDDGKTMYVNFWASNPGGDDCGITKPCAVKVIDGLAQ